MNNKIILGTANFVKPYGIFSKDAPLSTIQIERILKAATCSHNTIVDSAMGYGDISLKIPSRTLRKLQLITKFSVLDDRKDVEEMLQKAHGQFSKIYGLLIHDPLNISLVCKKELHNFLQSLKNKYPTLKMGVSLYELSDLEKFSSVFIPDLLQIPLNPFNQQFDNEDFKSFILDNHIEVHARSLFLQGVLLSESLPGNLKVLNPFWVEFRKKILRFPSPLHALFQWALQFHWIKSWVIGVSSVANYEEAIEVLRHTSGKCSKINFLSVPHPLRDPRNW